MMVGRRHGAAVIQITESGMRKISKTRSSNLDRNTLDSDLVDTRPRCIPGATITSWPGSTDIDLGAFFARSASDGTVTGAAHAKAAQVNRIVEGTVSLSDGTKITFATTGQFDTVELA
jgi:hypothetical protein